MELKITIYSDLMEWKENIEYYGDSLVKAYVDDEVAELDIQHIPYDLYLPIINNHLKGLLNSNDVNEISPFEGGLVIYCNDKKIEWTCCEFLTDFYHWEKTFNCKYNEWEKIWIGHPWVYFRIIGDKIQFSNYTEESGVNTSKLEVVCEIEYELFKKELLVKINKLKDFKTKVIDTIQKSNLPQKEIIKNKIL